MTAKIRVRNIREFSGECEKKVDFGRRSTRKINHGGGRGPFAVVGLVCYLDSALAVAFHCSSIERTKGALCMLDVPCLGWGGNEARMIWNLTSVDDWGFIADVKASDLFQARIWGIGASYRFVIRSGASSVIACHDGRYFRGSLVSWLEMG